MQLFSRWMALVAIGAFLMACASSSHIAKRYADKGQEHVEHNQWLDAVIAFRKAELAFPSSVEYGSRRRQAEFRAAEYYYKQGNEKFLAGQVAAAIAAFEQGLVAMPDNEKLRAAWNDAIGRREADRLVLEAQSLRNAGRQSEAVPLLRQAIAKSPRHAQGAALLESLLNEEVEKKKATEPSRPSQPRVTLAFRQTEPRVAFEFVAKSFGANILFDEAVRGTPISLYAKDVTFSEAMNYLCKVSKLFYVEVSRNTYIIAPDIRDKREQYEDQVIRTFPLSTIRAKDMSEILKSLLTLKKIAVNEQLNTLVVRDTKEVMKLVDRLVTVNDRKGAELILDVEILEVNKSKAERLGLDLTSYEVGLNVPAVPVKGSIAESIQQSATLTLPSAVFRFYKQDVDAKTLANPKIRVMNSKPAKIHIGDRVPLRSASVTDALGQVRTTYEYRDIGIRLTAEPTINLDNSAVVKLGLEVSSLGQNIGTAAEPAYSIGTRNAETTMLLRDGETAITGGLIRDEDRKTQVKVPLLGEIPLVGRLFASDDDAAGRTDILLTITPHVVRGWDFVGDESNAFLSGSGDVYQTQPLFPEVVASSEHVKQEPASAAIEQVNSQNEAASASLGPGPSQGPRSRGLRFDQEQYRGKSAETISLSLSAEDLGTMSEGTLELTYNPNAVRLSSTEIPEVFGGSAEVKEDKDSGRISIMYHAGYRNMPNGRIVLASMKAHLLQPGVSNLSYVLRGKLAGDEQNSINESGIAVFVVN